MDYCNLSGCPNKLLNTLQLIQNVARTSMRDHISLLSAFLHWLPVKFKIEFQIFLVTYKVINGQAPSYLRECFIQYHLIKSLCSQDTGLLVVPRVSKSRMGARAFRSSFVESSSNLELPLVTLGLKPSFWINIIVRASLE